jgi:predicted protein tyrosine phosphatase
MLNGNYYNNLLDNKMTIKALNLSNALFYVPKDKKSAIFHILDSWNFAMNFSDTDKKYGYCFKYYFDDIQCGQTNTITKEIATQIIEDFKSVKDLVDEVIIHCNSGTSRSPAVAKALADKFEYNHTGFYVDYNDYIYDMIIGL